jgi:hypothetical protein
MVRQSVRLWCIFVAASLLCVYGHELGHCAVAWVHGYSAVPTPAKEYIFGPMTEGVQRQEALGGLLGSVGALLAAMVWLYVRPTSTASALLAGTMTTPGFYTLRFILAGRGHDATEFQEAQAALGLSYSGHSADWLFAGLLVVSTVFWFWRTHTRVTLRLVGRLILGAFVALVALTFLQSVNNAVFDLLFEAGRGSHRHS